MIREGTTSVFFGHSVSATFPLRVRVNSGMAGETLAAVTASRGIDPWLMSGPGIANFNDCNGISVDRSARRWAC